MNQQVTFNQGDVVTHPRRPEWGQGIVKDAHPAIHEGQRVQRLAVVFANKGRVVLNTGVAPLELKGKDVPMTRTSFSTGTEAVTSRSGGAGNRGNGSGGWLGALERANGQTRHELWDLPESMTDPFASLAQRLRATVDSYRFSTEPRSLIDWAVAQTGLDDPLSKYTRPELEQAFPRFARDRDQHLKNLVWQLKRKGDVAVLQDVLRSTRHPAARSALEKSMRH